MNYKLSIDEIVDIYRAALGEDFTEESEMELREFWEDPPTSETNVLSCLVHEAERQEEAGDRRYSEILAALY